MKSKKAGRIAATWYAMAVVLALGSLIAVPPHLEGLAQVSIPEEIEWTWEVHCHRISPNPQSLILNSEIHPVSGNPGRTSVSQYQIARPSRSPSGNFRPSSPTAC